MINEIKKLYTLIKDVYGTLLYSIGSDGFDISQSWLVKHLFPKSSFGVIYGKSGSRKTFIAIDISCSIATGTLWQNQSVIAGAVVYVAAEGQTGMSRRIKAWEIANSKKVEHLYILGQSLLVSEASARKTLIESIHDIENKNNIKVQLVVFDTLARNFDGDENSSDAMGKFIHGCDLLKAETDCSILCVHHCGKDVSKGGRGSTALIGACDFEFQVTHNTKTQLTTLSNTKQKDAEPMPDLVFDFQTIDLGVVCEDNQPITSLALTASATIKKEKNDENNPILMGLNEVFNGCCTRAELRTIFPLKEGVKANTANQQFSRTLKELVETGKITIQQSGEKAHPNDIITVLLSN